MHTDTIPQWHQLSHDLRRIAGLKQNEGNLSVFEARSDRPIAAAQQTLELAAYRLRAWDMIEGSFYELRYWVPGRTEVRLQRLIGAAASPAVALCYRYDGRLIRVAEDHEMPEGSMSSYGVWLMDTMQARMPDVKLEWIPVFDNHWPASA